MPCRCCVVIARFLNKHVVFQNCKELIASVEETGLIVREIRDLEDQVWQYFVKKKHLPSTLEETAFATLLYNSAGRMNGFFLFVKL